MAMTMSITKSYANGSSNCKAKGGDTRTDLYDFYATIDKWC